MSTSIKKNFAYNIVNVVTQMLFPLVTFPYASRILLADGVGLVDFNNSIIQYIILLSSLGIPLYAIRETARVRNDAKQLSKVSLEIGILHTGLTILGYFAVFILCFSVDKIAENVTLFLLLSTSIFFNAIGCNWLFQGVEDFKYITIRSLIVKLISIAGLYILVKTREDLLWYAMLMVLSTVGGNVFNLFRMRLYMNPSLHHIKELRPLKHLKPCLRIFALNLIISIYCNLDIVMLGFLTDSTQVGYYVAANKIEKILKSVVTALGTVMLPRFSNLIAEGKTEEFGRLSQKSVDFIIALSLPMLAGIILMARPTINLFCGDSYAPATLSLQLLAPLILVIGLSNVMGIQILYPQGKEHLVMISTGVGAFVNFCLNWFLIPTYGCDGAAISTLIAEIGVTLTMAIIGAKFFPFTICTKQNALVVMSSSIMLALCILATSYIDGDFNKMLIIPIIGAVIYGGCMLFFKTPIAMETYGIVKNKLLKRNKSIQLIIVGSMLYCATS